MSADDDRLRDRMGRQNAAYAGPSGSWAQRWLPWVCKHATVRCTHGDEIIGRRFRRRVCMVCGRALRGPIPAMCWFTGGRHSDAAQDGA